MFGAKTFSIISWLEGWVELWVNFSFLLNQNYMCKATTKRKWIITQGKCDEIFFKRKQKLESVSSEIIRRTYVKFKIKLSKGQFFLNSENIPKWSKNS